jgi:hypothetical protein
MDPSVRHREVSAGQVGLIRSRVPHARRTDASRGATYRIRDREWWPEFLAFLKLLRARWPGHEL